MFEDRKVESEEPIPVKLESLYFHSFASEKTGENLGFLRKSGVPEIALEIVVFNESGVQGIALEIVIFNLWFTPCSGNTEKNDNAYKETGVK